MATFSRIKSVKIFPPLASQGWQQPDGILHRARAGRRDQRAEGGFKARKAGIKRQAARFASSDTTRKDNSFRRLLRRRRPSPDGSSREQEAAGQFRIDANTPLRNAAVADRASLVIDPDRARTSDRAKASTPGLSWACAIPRRHVLTRTTVARSSGIRAFRVTGRQGAQLRKQRRWFDDGRTVGDGTGAVSPAHGSDDRCRRVGDRRARFAPPSGRPRRCMTPAPEGRQHLGAEAPEAIVHRDIYPILNRTIA